MPQPTDKAVADPMPQTNAAAVQRLHESEARVNSALLNMRLSRIGFAVFSIPIARR